MATAHAAASLKEQIMEGDLQPVWPDSKGDVRGVTFEPLHKAAPAYVRHSIAADVRSLLGDRDFVEALAGYLLPDAASQARRGLLEARLRNLAGGL